MNPAHANCVPGNNTYPYWDGTSVPTQPYWDGAPNYGDAVPWQPPTIPWVPDIPIVPNPGTATISTGTWEPERTIYAVGTFDLFHYGHISFLKACKRVVGDRGRVVVALNDTEFPTFPRETDPLPYYQRKVVLDACEYVDKVVKNEGKSTIERFHPDFLAFGTNWLKMWDDQVQVNQEWLDVHDITLIFFPYYGEITSEIVRAQLGRK